MAVPDNFKFTMFYTQALGDNQIWALNNSAGRWMPGNNEGIVGLNFFSANDPRVPMCIGGSAACKTFDANQTRTTSFDNNFGPGTFLVQLNWPTREADISIATGTEARLIEAEVALRTGDIATWLAKLNQPSSRYQIPAQRQCRSTVARRSLSAARCLRSPIREPRRLAKICFSVSALSGSGAPVTGWQICADWFAQRVTADSVGQKTRFFRMAPTTRVVRTGRTSSWSSLWQSKTIRSSMAASIGTRKPQPTVPHPSG